MRSGQRPRVPALVVGLAVLLAVASLPASAAGKRKIFVTKTDENFNGHAGVTFELYQDLNGDGILQFNEPKIDTQVTDSAGKATFANLARGDYIINEIPPDGYNDVPNEPVKIQNKNKEVVFANTRAPGNNRVNDPLSDTSHDDGTHVSDFGPSVAADPSGNEVVVVWNDTTGVHTPGDVSLTNTARSVNGGQTWQQLGKLPTGSESRFNLGGPVVLNDPIRGRWVAASAGVEATPDGLIWPILVNPSGGPSGFWRDPVNATPDIEPDSGDIAHTPSLALDRRGGGLYLGFILSDEEAETSEALITRSSDGGASWEDATPLSPTGEVDFIDVAVGRTGSVHAVWRRYTSSATFAIEYSRSTDGGQTWTTPQAIANGLPRTGTPNTCIDTGAGSILGQVYAANAPSIAASPIDASRLFVTTHTHGPGADEADVVLFGSGNGGNTWSQLDPVPANEGMPQWYPSVEVSRDGRVAVAYYDARSPTEIGVTMSVFSSFDDDLVGTIAMSRQGFAPWQMNPSFDTDITNCHGMDKFHFVAPGSGFFVAWTDGRDPGPAGNDGIDPNIYFARTEGPFIPTTLSASIGFTASKLKVKGKLLPAPLKGARVTVTLFHDDGGGFEQVGRARPRVSGKGAWSATFGRAGLEQTCRVVVEFGGAEGRAPSVPVTKNFAC